MTHAITAGTRTSNRAIANGRQNRRMPVSLLDIECGTVSFRCLHDPMMIPASLTSPMAVTHSHTHSGKSIDGRIIIAEQMTKTRSTTLSILEPSPLSAFIFLAIAPSIISESPPQQYSTQNPGLKTGKNSIARAATPLDAEMMFGKDLIQSNFK